MPTDSMGPPVRLCARLEKGATRGREQCGQPSAGNTPNGYCREHAHLCSKNHMCQESRSGGANMCQKHIVIQQNAWRKGNEKKDARREKIDAGLAAVTLREANAGARMWGRGVQSVAGTSVEATAPDDEAPAARRALTAGPCS